MYKNCVSSVYQYKKAHSTRSKTGKIRLEKICNFALDKKKGQNYALLACLLACLLANIVATAVIFVKPLSGIIFPNNTLP